MNLRGAFNPKVQIASGVVVIALYLHMIRFLWTTELEPRADFWFTGVALLGGILLGIYIGRLRLRALWEVLPQVEGKFYLSERGALSRIREGENAMVLQRNAWAVAFLIWFAAATFWRQLFYASLVSFIFGSYLVGQFLPFIRLYLGLRRQHTAGL